MATIITEQTPGKVHKTMDHDCFKDINVLLKGLYDWGHFCPYCGESLEEDGILTSYKCSSCEASLYFEEGMKYCPDCGLKFV